EGIRLVVGTPEGKMEIRSPLIGRHNAYNILGAVGVALHEGVPKEQIVRGIESLKSVPGRLERVDEGQNFAVLVDYAHTDDALKNVLSALRHLAKKRIITLFGCGGNRDKDKREKMAKVAVALSDYVVITSDNPRNEDPQAIIDDIEKGIPTEEKGELGKMQGGRHTAICDRRLAIEHGLDSAQKGDIVLIAGKGHEEYQIIGDEKIHFDDREVARNFLRSTV
ncbi:MAG: Mur ligase family protein, partial [Nitrospinota bacterium]